MKGQRQRTAILIFSATALILTGLGVLVIVDPTAFGISTASNCSGGCFFEIPRWWIYGGLLASVGGLSAFVAVVLAAVDAGQHGDRRSLGLIILAYVVSYGVPAYLSAAFRATYGPAGQSAGAPSLALVLVVGGASTVLGPVSALAYTVLREQPTPRLAALGGLVAAVVLAALVVAPPWLVLGPANAAPSLAASAPATTADCAHGQYPAITVKNAGGGTLRWTAFAAFDAVTIHPSGGSLGPGGSQTVALAGAYVPSADRPQLVGVEFDGNGGSQRVELACAGAAAATPTAVGGLIVSPAGLVAHCVSNEYPPITITNAGKSDATWSVSTKEPGIGFTPASGTLAPGQSQTIAIFGPTTSPGFTIFVNGGQQTVGVACK
jgi:hypothetical protein